MTHVRLSRLLGAQRRMLVPLAVVGLAVSATYVAQALVTAHVFGTVVADGPGRDLLADLTAPLLALAGVLLARPLVVLLRELLVVRVMTTVKTRLRDQVGVQLMRESVHEAGSGRTGRDNATVVDGIENLDAYLARYLPSLLLSGVVTAVVAVILVLIDPVVGAVVVVAAAAVPLLPRLWDKALARRGSDHWDAYQELHAEFVDSMQGMSTLVLFGAAERRQRELAAASDRLLARTLAQLKLSLIESGLNAFALSAVPLVALIMLFVRQDSLGAAETFAVVLLSVELVRPLRDLASQWHAGYLGTFSGEQISAVLARRPDDADTTPPVVDRAAVVRLDDVTFAYPGADAARPPALDGVGLLAGPGLTAMVGASGSGKSTVASLVAGLAEPTSGRVAVGAATSARERLAHVALVPQDPTLFPGDVRSNITLGLDPDGPVPCTVEAAARLAGIGTDDPTLTLESPVGERGGLVSGGQRQRIAIARGLVQGRPVLVLDEATSALDVDSETALVRRLMSARPGLPLLVVAHRLDAVRDARTIVVMADGRVVDHGDHDTLMRRCDRYVELVRAGATAGAGR
ncbi:ABC transporter ATP-binding protein/permease [Aeromicrobium sp. CnD17-E]|uniref:ABC transporter ATP-binding protein/permease n=1 Tax=Aeromicrobium sp. CnD17-E TaxID=2954487 RepID=UPI0020973AC9|nr:ATP-binding cassette domain-containing protein [Aeromicrobium sp. CnD17-E]MCO7237910.1 ATP-binding cassette domain-containing protein [Aeromicrobium sp. CnD17-E]